MSKAEAILRYKASMSLFKKWLSDGAITQADLLAISAAIAERHGLSTRSIYLENDLLCGAKRVINTTAKGGRQAYEDNES